MTSQPKATRRGRVRSQKSVAAPEGAEGAQESAGVGAPPGIDSKPTQGMKNGAQNGQPRQLEAPPPLLQKTKMCKFHLLGICSKGEGCVFAHYREELNPRPDLYRTKLCKTLINTGQCRDRRCTYAHNRDELRASTARKGNKVCKFWEAGHCELGASCGYAHSSPSGGASLGGVPSSDMIIALNKGSDLWPGAPLEHMAKEVVVIDAATYQPLYNGTVQVKRPGHYAFQQHNENGCEPEPPPNGYPMRVVSSMDRMDMLAQEDSANGMGLNHSSTPRASHRQAAADHRKEAAALGPSDQFNPIKVVSSMDRMDLLAQDDPSPNGLDHNGDPRSQRHRQQLRNSRADSPNFTVDQPEHGYPMKVVSSTDRLSEFGTDDSNAGLGLFPGINVKRTAEGDVWVVRNTFVDMEEPKVHPLRPIASCAGRFEGLSSLGSGDDMLKYFG